MDPVLSLSPSSPFASLQVRRSPMRGQEEGQGQRQGKEEDLFGTFLQVAKNCLAFPPPTTTTTTLTSIEREDRDSMNRRRHHHHPHSCSPLLLPPPPPPPSSRLLHSSTSTSSSTCTSSTSNTKRVRKRHPATIQTPGRRVPTEEESAVEPLTSTSSNTTPCTDVFDEELDEDHHPFSSSHYHYHHEEELMILGKWEFDEEGFPGQNKESPFEEEWFNPSENRIRTFSDAAKIEDLYQFPRKKLSNSLNGDIPVLTLYS